jgi:anti-anti-sigma factor
MGRAVVLENRLRVTGEFDRTNASVLGDALDDLTRRIDGEIVIDLTGVTYLDSSGLAALWRCAERRPRVLVGAGSLMERVLGVVGFNEIAIIEPRT